MNYEQEQQFAAEVKRYVTEHLPLSQISDSELQQQIEDIVEQRIGAGYCSIEQRVSIVEQVYSSIRGFGLLPSHGISRTLLRPTPSRSPLLPRCRPSR